MRKILREAKWTVTLTPAGQQAQPVQKQVEAPTQDAAIRRAINMFPNMQFVRTEAVALDPTAVPLGQQPLQPQQQLPRGLAGLRQIRPLLNPAQYLQQQQQQQQQQQPQQQESVDPRLFSYPYSIRLPAQFARVLRESSPVAVAEQNGQYEIVLMDAAAMRSLIERLAKHRNRDARTILNGIRSTQGDW